MWFRNMQEKLEKNIFNQSFDKCFYYYFDFFFQLRQEKVQLEHTLEQEQECLVNKLMRRIEKVNKVFKTLAWPSIEVLNKKDSDI